MESPFNNPLSLVMLLAAMAQDRKAKRQPGDRPSEKVPCDCPGCSVHNAAFALAEAQQSLEAAKTDYAVANEKANAAADGLNAAGKVVAIAREALDKAIKDFNAEALDKPSKPEGAQ